MEIYQIEFNYNFALADVVSSKPGADSLNLTQDKPEELGNFSYSWLTDESEVIPDFILIMRELLGCKLSIQEEMSGIIKSTRMIPITVGKDSYVIFCHIPVLSDCLNLKKSKISRFSDGDIMDIKEPVFLPGDYPTLFQVKNIPSAYFCNQLFKQKIDTKSYTGLLFKQIKIKPKSWL